MEVMGCREGVFVLLLFTLRRSGVAEATDIVINVVDEGQRERDREPCWLVDATCQLIIMT